MEKMEKENRHKPYFACPICGKALEQEEKICRCAAGHCFDKAAEGYVHLLPSQYMHSKIPGDTREMVAARRRFLESGAYDLFARELETLVQEAFARKEEAEARKEGCLLDVGCGEGYYTGRMARALEQAFPGEVPGVLGFDISKFAVKAAAKKYGKQADFAVASAFRIPAEDGISRCTVNVFAPIEPGELRRVTGAGGRLILAVPSPRHLYGLKEILYTEPYENQRKDTEYPGFRFLFRRQVEGVLELRDGNALQDLFAMTPYYWKTPREGGERLRQTSQLKTEIGFDFLVYERTEEP